MCKSLIRSCYVHNHMIIRFIHTKKKCHHCRLNLKTCFSKKSNINQVFKMRIGVERHFQQYFSYIMVVNFIGEENRNTQRKPLTCLKTLINIITLWVMAMVLNATFNNLSDISWRSVLLVEETRVPGENNRPAASHWKTLSHNVVSPSPGHERGLNWQL